MTSPHEPTRIALDPQTVGNHREMLAALELLARGAAYALDADSSPWDFAVEIESLTNLGLTTNDLRWLVAKGYVEHADEVTSDADAHRRFEPCRHQAFEKRTCFVLTALGARLMAPPRPGAARADADGRAGANDRPPSRVESAACLPSWDDQRRVLRVGERIVKKFRVPCSCQEAVLAAFEEEGWPPAIDDPLRPHPERDAKRRLRDTIKGLNLCQVNSILCFRGDGSGTRILWELTEPAEEVPAIRVRRGIRAA
jgi:hypothetical protein